MPLTKPWMRHYLILLAGALLTSAAQAQTPGMTSIILPKIKNFKAGSYQLADGSWQSGKLYFAPGRQLEVKPPDTKQHLVYWPTDVRRFVIGADTFGVASDLTVTSRRRIPQVFARQLYRTPYHTVFFYQTPDHTLESEFTGVDAALQGNYTIVQATGGPSICVPQGRGAFTEAMLPFFGDCPELAEGIKRGKLGPQHVQRIAATYAKWKRASPAPATPAD